MQFRLEFAHLYPVYRKHVISGRIADDDAGTLQDATQILRRMSGFNPGVVLAPLGVGGHVDHVLVRTAAEQSGNRVVYYSDFPYNQRAAVHDGFIQDRGLVEMPGGEPAQAKIGLIKAYASQLGGLFDGGKIPLVPEVYFSAPGGLQDFPAGSSEHFAKGRFVDHGRREAQQPRNEQPQRAGPRGRHVSGGDQLGQPG